MKICRKCNNEVMENIRYCPYCKASLKRKNSITLIIFLLTIYAVGLFGILFVLHQILLPLIKH